MDETRFLSSFYKQYRDKGFEVIGLAYERDTDQDKNRRLVKRMTDRFDVTYEMLLTGYTNQQVEESMPALRNFMARTEEHKSELQTLIRKSYAVFCLQQK